MSGRISPAPGGLQALVGGGVSVPWPGLAQHFGLEQFLGIHLRTDALGSHRANPEAEEQQRRSRRGKRQDGFSSVTFGSA